MEQEAFSLKCHLDVIYNKKYIVIMLKGPKSISLLILVQFEY